MGDTTISAPISDDFRDEIEEYLNNSNETNSIAHLVRIALHQHINDNNNQTTQAKREVQLESQKLDTIHEEVLELRSEIEKIEKEQTKERTTEIQQQAIYDTLATIRQNELTGDILDNVDMFGMTMTDIHDETGMSYQGIEQGIRDLSEVVSVESVSKNEAKYYYIEA